MRSLSAWSVGCLGLSIAIASMSHAQQTAVLPGAQIRESSPPPRLGEGSEENMVALQLRNPLSSAAPETGEFQEDPFLTMEMVRLSWRANDPIDLYIMKPKGVAKPPVALYLYSYPSESDKFLNMELGRFLTQHGCAAVGFVSA